MAIHRGGRVTTGLIRLYSLVDLVPTDCHDYSERVFSRLQAYVRIDWMMATYLAQ